MITTFVERKKIYEKQHTENKGSYQKNKESYQYIVCLHPLIICIHKNKGDYSTVHCMFRSIIILIVNYKIIHDRKSIKPKPNLK